jgi:oligopeptide/dipeptide ABC transporter ATP-binding protein
LLSSVPIISKEQKSDRIILKGDVPSPKNPPKGCKFHTRCFKFHDTCDTIIVKNKEIKENHFVKCNLY